MKTLPIICLAVSRITPHSFGKIGIVQDGDRCAAVEHCGTQRFGGKLFGERIWRCRYLENKHCVLSGLADRLGWREVRWGDDTGSGI